MREEIPLTLEEWRGNTSSKLTRTAVFTPNSSAAAAAFSTLNLGSRWTNVRVKILDAFLPEGYPGSVTPDYLPFQVWDLLQGLSTYIRAMLSTQALLSAIGVGEKSATVIGATFQWFLRDFTGMLGVVCFGSLSRSLTGVASGATRAALTQHFALENNAADISAKEGSQETVATMIGMVLGMLLAHIAGGHPLAIWICFLSLTVLHMYANYKAVCCLSLRTLNNERSSLLLQHFMETHQVLSPHHVSTMEHVFPTWISSWSSYITKYKLPHKCVNLGTRVSSLKHDDMMELLRLASSHYRNERYTLLERNGTVSVITHKDSTPADTLQSSFHALVITNLVDKTKSLHKESQEWMNEHYQTFIVKLQSSGWMTERLLTPTIVWRANWVHASLDDKRK